MKTIKEVVRKIAQEMDQAGKPMLGRKVVLKARGKKGLPERLYGIDIEWV